MKESFRSIFMESTILQRTCASLLSKLARSHRLVRRPGLALLFSLRPSDGPLHTLVVMNVLRVLAVLTVLAVAAFLFFSLRRERRAQDNPLEHGVSV